MLIRVKFNAEQKYVKIIDLTFEILLIGAFLKFEIPLTSLSEAKLYDGSGTEVDGDVFEEVVKRPDLGVFKLTLNNDAKESSLTSPVSASSVMVGSDHESDDTIILSEDGSPSRKRQRSDDEAKNMKDDQHSCFGDDRDSWEHYYNPNSGEGYLSYRIKTVQRNLASSEKQPTQLYPGAPTAERESSPSTLVTIEQDFVLLFGEGTLAKFLERWPTTFKQKIIMLSMATQGAELQELIQMPESAVDEGADTNADRWDGDLSSILLLLHLIPPSSQGCKRPDRNQYPGAH
ncbi:hypothetical protein J4Q44_G00214470 [Coregonus suidteri]|uniref:Uncharacterized protein n=1 Tax=Coregonus suidteri TaxID=861788 RepID=A0AAN8LTZ1_9TELE